MKKHILKENYERFFGKREFGDPLPTFKGVMKKHQGEGKESVNESDFKAWKKADGDWKKEQRKIEQIVKKFFSKHDIDVDDRPISHKLKELQDVMGDALTQWSVGL